MYVLAAILNDTTFINETTIMTTFTNEEILLTSDDKTITLTNHRIIYKTPEVNQEMLLKDFVGYEIIQKKEKYFLGLAAAAVVAFIFYGSSLRNSHPRVYLIQPQNVSEPALFYILIILPFVFYFCYNALSKKILKISGHNNTIEFSIKNLSQNSLNNFITKLSVESNNRKKEKE